MIKRITYIALCALLLMFSAFTAAAQAAVPIRVSIKYILDVNGNRPATGNLNTDAEITAELDWGNRILSSNNTEYQIHVIERVDLIGVSAYYGYNATDANRDALRAAAIADPATFHWRTDAINIYINGGTGSAISKFPPDNDIILMNQWCGNTPSCILHEMGHSLNLMHTHEPCCTNQDECADTITDNSSWTKDQVAQHNFGTTYNNLTASQKNQVDLVYNNVMSYHTDEPQLRLSYCQMGRCSSQGDSDRSWLLTKAPIYVNKYLSSILCPFSNGSYGLPFCTLQSALDAGGLANKVLVLEQGAYTMTQETINANVEMVTRAGASTVTRGVQDWKLPVDLSASANPDVRRTVRAAQDHDTAVRKIEQQTQERTSRAATDSEKAAIKKEADNLSDSVKEKAIIMLQEAEGYASGDEKTALQLELAQRLFASGKYGLAAKYFNLVAEGTDQPKLRAHANRKAGESMKKEAEIKAGQ